MNILLNFDSIVERKGITDWNAYSEYTPEKVMEIFRKVVVVLSNPSCFIKQAISSNRVRPHTSVRQNPIQLKHIWNIHVFVDSGVMGQSDGISRKPDFECLKMQ